MRFRHTILCLAVALLCLMHGSNTAYGQPFRGYEEAYDRYTSLYQQGQYSEALQYATEALRLAEEIAEEERHYDKYNEAKLYAAMARGFAELGDRQAAQIFVGKTLKIVSQRQSGENDGFRAVSIGFVLLSLGDTAGAKTVLESAIEILEDLERIETGLHTAFLTAEIVGLQYVLSRKAAAKRFPYEHIYDRLEDQIFLQIWAARRIAGAGFFDDARNLLADASRMLVAAEISIDPDTYENLRSEVAVVQTRIENRVPIFVFD